LAISLSYFALILLRYALFLVSLGLFSTKGCWILLKAFSASVLFSVYVLYYVD
jgi:hypothetical protein